MQIASFTECANRMSEHCTTCECVRLLPDSKGGLQLVGCEHRDRVWHPDRRNGDAALPDANILHIR
jgi:hypothetical protein